jgi:xanthine/uracil/vitamin C permease (AzgA family)
MQSPGVAETSTDTLANSDTVATSGGWTTGRPARFAAWVVTGLVTAFLGFDAVTHIVREAHVVAINERMGGPAWFPVVCGVVLALCLVAYLLPRTATLGAVLIVGYLGGACAANLLTGQPLVNCLYAITAATLAWAGLWPRDSRLRYLVAAR